MSYYETFKLYINSPEAIKDTVALAVIFFCMAGVISAIITIVGGMNKD